MNTPKDTQKRAKVHSLADALSDKVERASRSLGFEPTNEIAPVIDIKAGEQLLWIDVDLIEDNPFQPRTDYPNEAQLDLIRTINADGQLMPIGVRPHSTLQGRFQARFGHRRKYAVSTGAFLTDESGEERRIYANAGVKQHNPSSYIGQIWCVVRPVSDAEMRREAWQENSARLDLPIMDQARFFVETRAALSEGQIRPASWQKTADFLGEKDRVNVFRVGSLLDLPKPMQEALEIGPRGEKPMLNERHGRALLLLQTLDGAESHKKAQRELFREIKRYLLSGGRGRTPRQRTPPVPGAKNAIGRRFAPVRDAKTAADRGGQGPANQCSRVALGSREPIATATIATIAIGAIAIATAAIATIAIATATIAERADAHATKGARQRPKCPRQAIAGIGSARNTRGRTNAGTDNARLRLYLLQSRSAGD